MLVMACVAACSSEPSRFISDPDASSPAVDAGGATDVGEVVDRGVIPIRDSGPQLDMTLVYAHSSSVLWAVDPRTNTLRNVGTFSFAAGAPPDHSMTDVAVDANGGLVGTTSSALYRIDTASAACTLIAMLPIPSGVGSAGFVGLTYLPAGTLDPSSEVLVGGASNGTYWRIDPSTGIATMLGQMRVGSTTYQLSGDFVSVQGAGTFATVRTANASSGSPDQLARVNESTGELTLIGSTGFQQIFGLAYYRNTLYGFTNAGQFISIDIMTGRGRMISTPAMQFYGAGVTTLAPIAPG